MDVTCVSDLHGNYPKLHGGDLLIVAGDLTAKDTFYEHAYFYDWISMQPYQKKIFIAGNHDNEIENNIDYDKSVEYLRDSGTEFEGLKIWGSPWSLTFPRIHPRCRAFTCTEDEIKEHFDKIPEDIEILITHTPPFMFLDRCQDGSRAGSTSLSCMITRKRLPKLKLHVFGHIHENGGQIIQTRIRKLKLVNASYVDEDYQPIHEPARVIL